MKKIICIALYFLISFHTSGQVVDLPWLNIDDPVRTYVAIIGNEDYQSFRSDFTPNAHHAIYDAERFKRFLIHEKNLPAKNISIYFDATAAHIKLYLSKLNKQAKNTGKKSEIIFYFSGKYTHSSIPGEIQIVPLDVFESDTRNAISINEIVEKFSQLPSKKVICLFDATPHDVVRNLSILDNHENHLKLSISKSNAIDVYITNSDAFYKEGKPERVPPKISLLKPDDGLHQELKITEKEIFIKGIATDNTGISVVSIMGEEAHLENDGSFKARVPLNIGKNAISIKAYDSYRNNSKMIIQVERIASDIQDKDIIIESPSDEFDNSEGGQPKFFALIIGINEYSDPAISDLDNPINDAHKLAEVLVNQYSFEKRNLYLLEDANREDIIAELDRLETDLSESDNLLIFFAGHGAWDEKTQKGYWLPSDAKHSNTANWIRNSTVSGYISGIKTKHTLLIADACFSGGIFRTRGAFSVASDGINRIYNLTSRKAMTSGTIKEVPDVSVFNNYLIKKLNENQERFLPSEKLFFEIKPPIVNNSENIPQFGVIKNTGDEGGDFIFVKN